MNHPTSRRVARVADTTLPAAPLAWSSADPGKQLLLHPPDGDGRQQEAHGDSERQLHEATALVDGHEKRREGQRHAEEHEGPDQAVEPTDEGLGVVEVLLGHHRQLAEVLGQGYRRAPTRAAGEPSRTASVTEMSGMVIPDATSPTPFCTTRCSTSETMGSRLTRTSSPSSLRFGSFL